MAKQHGVFRFRQFEIDHSRSAMKVGTDGVLLGAWADVYNSKNILDIGAGTGLIALMLAQRTMNGVQIDAVEIDSEEASIARANIQRSPWPHRINVVNARIQDYSPLIKYDHIVSNPPFFNNSLKAPGVRRTESRHTISLSFDELIQAVLKLRTDDGKFSVILPVAEGSRFIDLVGDEMALRRKFSFRARKNKPVERLLLEFGTAGGRPEEGEIILYDNQNRWSKFYRELTREFYLDSEK